jgi:glutathione synthase/RimK-type ligase-like ATP-grasp enzyme
MKPGNMTIESTSKDTLIEERIRALTDLLGLRYAAIDFLQDNNGNLFFLEINPHGSFEFCNDYIEPSISERIASYLRSCL